MAISTSFSNVSNQKTHFEFQQNTFLFEDSNMYKWYLTKMIREKTIINKQILIFFDRMLAYYKSWKSNCDSVLYVQMKGDIENIIVTQWNFVKSIQWKNICHFFLFATFHFQTISKKSFSSWCTKFSTMTIMNIKSWIKSNMSKKISAAIFE